MIKRGHHVEVTKGLYLGDTGIVRQQAEDGRYWVDCGGYVGHWFYEHELRRINPPATPVPETWWDCLWKLWPF